MLDITLLSTCYDVRRLDASNADEIWALCKANTQYYEYCQAEPTREHVLSDLQITPPGTDLSSKYYVGFYQGDTLVAVMDLIDGYPEPNIAYIGFFMMNKALQSRKIGSGIIGEASDYLKSCGKKSIHLGIAKDNPQATHFWRKNGFIVLREVEQGGWTALVAERTL